MIKRLLAAHAAAGVIALMLVMGPLAQAASIVSNKHNLSATGPGTIKATSEGEICVFCHVPHNAASTGPLWNRDQPTGPYVPYTSTTRKITAPGAPTGTSLLCLSCHDGTIALGKISSRSTNIAMAGGKTNFAAGDASYIGTDLSDDHPVSFLYSNVLANTELRTPTAPVKLDASGQLQCTACHSPHDNANGKFLVVNNIGSALCRNCHNKPYWAASDHATSAKTWSGSGTNPWPHTSYAPQNVASNACENCHRPHTAPGKKQLLNSATEETNCLVCHSGTVAASSKDIATEFTKLSHHGVASYSGIHDAAEPNLVSSVHVECSDCHNPHSANATAGAAPGGSAVTIPGGISNVRGVSIANTAVNPATAEYEICLRCHGSGTAKTPAPSTARVITQNDKRLQFDTANPSFHPVAASGKSATVPSLITGWSTTSRVKCTDCHNNNDGPYSTGTGITPSGTNANGPHGSIYPTLLERQYLKADGVSTSAGTTESAAAYALCYKCHDRTKILANTPGGFSEHSLHVSSQRTPCNTCHDPHGVSSSLGGTALSNSRLINFNTAIVTKSGTQAIRWERVGTSGGRCYLVCHGKNHNPISY
jgi:predicted CXXCH cytochrome family protein